MPFSPRISGQNLEAEARDALHGRLAASLKTHAAHLSLLRLERLRAGKTRAVPSPNETDFSYVAEAEDLDDLCSRVASHLIDTIYSEANGKSWKGSIVFLAVAPSGKPPAELLRFPVDVDASDEVERAPTREGELTATLEWSRRFMNDQSSRWLQFLDKVNGILDSHRQMATGLHGNSVADQQAQREHEAKMQESRERMHATQVRAEANVHHRRETKWVVRDLLLKYQPIFENITYAARDAAEVARARAAGRTATDAPPRKESKRVTLVEPSVDEARKLFAQNEGESDEYNAAMAELSPMAVQFVELSTGETKGELDARAKLHRQLWERFNALSARMQGAFVANANDTLGTTRVGELVAWFRKL